MRRLGAVSCYTSSSTTWIKRQGWLLIGLALAINQAAVSLAAPLEPNQPHLSLSLAAGGGRQERPSRNDDGAGQQRTWLMEQIMRDEFSHDFELSIRAMNQLARSLEEFVTREQMADGVGKQENLVTLWTASRGGSSLSVIVKELDYIMSTFWSKFKPLIEVVVAQRPEQLGLDDLDFRCRRRTNELAELKAMGAHSSIYSMYLDTFYSELHLHCLIRKLALIKNTGVAPSSLVKQFVDIYLDLPTSRNPLQPNSKELQEQAAHQLLAGRAINFKLEETLARHGPLSVAAQLVFDPRVALSLAPGSNNVEGLLQEFETDCRSHTDALAHIWADFDGLAAFLSSETSNLADLNAKVKMAAPQLAYGAICSQLLKLPRA